MARKQKKQRRTGAESLTPYPSMSTPKPSKSTRSSSASTPNPSKNTRSGGKRKKRILQEEEEENDVADLITCGICLLEEGKAVGGQMDCCSHYFCYVCIMEWAKKESLCPICKKRFRCIRRPPKDGVFACDRIVEVPVRDQAYSPLRNDSRGPSDPHACLYCTECQSSEDQYHLLLCDLCNSAMHTFCVGLGVTVPDGNWYCHDCTVARNEHTKRQLCSSVEAISTSSSSSMISKCRMAPKSSKGKRPAASTSTFDQERFSNAESADRFKSDFTNRTVIFERIVVHTDFCLTHFLNWLHLNRLMVLMNLVTECFDDWVRDFYCNMHEVSASKFKTFVRGKTLTVDANKIALLLNLQRPAKPSYPFPNPDNVALQKDEVAAVLCREPTIWNSAVLKIDGLTSDYRLLNNFVCHNMEPRVHSSDLLFPQAALLYYLGTGTSVDVALTIFNSMLRIYDEKRKRSLPFGAMISKLLIEAGCHVYPNEIPLPKRQKIDRRTKAMSDSHVNNRIQGERAHAQVLEEEDEGSIENRLLAVEHTIFDQSLQIEHLQERMTAGFDDLKNQLTDMFNHLRQR